MKTMQKVSLCILLAITLAFQPAHAAGKKDKAARENQRRMAQLKQQMEAEKAELQAGFEKQKAELQEKIEQSEKVSNQLKGTMAEASRRNATLIEELASINAEKTELQTIKTRIEAELITTKSSLDSTSTTLTDTQKTLAEAQKDLKANEAQRKDIAKSLVQRDQWITSCSEKNAKLRDFGFQLVNVYDNTSTYEAIMRTEPFAQIKRVELENILQEYRDKIDEQAVKSISK